MISYPAVIFVGKLPPPYIGPAVATEILLNSKLRDEFKLLHLDTSDHRDINTLGRIDFQNVYLALKQYLKLTWLLAVKKPDLVYLPNKQTTVGFLQDLPIMVLSKLFRKKLVCHLRGGNFKNWYNSLGAIMKWLVRKAYVLVDAQLVLGDNLTDLFKGTIGVEKIQVVPNGGNFEFPKNGRHSSDKTRILYLANFIESKGPLDTLHSVQKLNTKLNEVQFLFAGSWDDFTTKSKFEAVLKEHPHLPVEVVGPVHGREKLQLLSSADIFVYPTYYPPEGHPWVIVEAMAAGLPIISTDQGAITESVIDGVNGFIVEKRNPQHIAEKLELLIENPELRETMGRASRKLYEENFTEARMVEKLTAVFNEVLSE